jgi:ribonuclease HI
MKLIIHTDGGARGNPGPAGIGVVIEEEGKTIAKIGKVIGNATNNVAEYTAVVEALKEVKEKNYHPLTIDFFLDSTLVVNQLNGMFKVKEPHLRELISMIRILEQEVGGEIRYHTVPRQQNMRADFLVNRALDDSLMLD